MNRYEEEDMSISAGPASRWVNWIAILGYAALCGILISLVR